MRVPTWLRSVLRGVALWKHLESLLRQLSRK